MEVPMAMGRPKAVLVLDAELREQLESLANSRSLPAGLVRRAKIILLSASGKTNVEIARQLETSKVTVSLWRCRFLRQGVSGLYDELRPGRPRPISDERVAQLVRKTLKTKPKAGTHWSIRQIADETGVSKSTVHRIWQAFGLQPHRQKQFKLSSDPFFVEKVRDIVGLYLNPTYASWLNQVEIWFNRITQQAIRRGTFSSVKDLVEKIDHYVQNSNRRAQPFVWTATADSIFAKVERLCERIYGTAH